MGPSRTKFRLNEHRLGANDFIRVFVSSPDRSTLAGGSTEQIEILDQIASLENSGAISARFPNFKTNVKKGWLTTEIFDVWIRKGLKRIGVALSWLYVQAEFVEALYNPIADVFKCDYLANQDAATLYEIRFERQQVVN